VVIPSFLRRPIRSRYDGELYEFEIPSLLRTTYYDCTYDNKHGSLNSVACSNGQNGLVSRYPTFGKHPSFPYIGGAFDIAWNSPNCGGCWKTTNKKNRKSIYIIATDTAGHSFNLAEAAFRKLNNGQLGNTLEVTAQKVPPSIYGL
jgi:hypothetical protein